MTSRTALLGLIAGGCVGGLTTVASAQPFLINISGATLQENFLKSQASTNDFFDFDGDTFLGEQLAFFDVAPPFASTPPLNHWWTVQYRAVGSGNGFTELTTWGLTTPDPVTPMGFAVAPLDIRQSADEAFNNRTLYISGTPIVPPADLGNPGAAPNTATTDGTYQALTSGGGIQVDIAPTDTPASWVVVIDNESDAAWFRQPTDMGYGNNPNAPVNKDGTPTMADNKLEILPPGVNFDTANSDSGTLFATETAIVPIAAAVSYGVGETQTTMTNLRYLFLTGRSECGENLMVITRDNGSGTQNAFENPLGVDPSWGTGENIGARSDLSSTGLVGPDYQPSNRGGSSNLENVLRNTRLAVGQTGAERGVNSGWLTGNVFNLLAVQNDLFDPNGPFVRPTIDALLDNAPPNGYPIVAPAVLNHFGDPKAEPISEGGEGNGNTRMRNPHAADYLNNIILSIAAFEGDPGADETVFSPGEFLALNFLLPAAADYIQAENEPTIFIPNPGLNQDLQDFTRTNNIVFNNPEFASFNMSKCGPVPTRTTGIAYSEANAPGGSATGMNYVDQSGASVNYGDPLDNRNKIQGDFFFDGERDCNDIDEMMAAYFDRIDQPGVTTWQSGTSAIIEVLGDFNCDGNFDELDIRYFGDGLAIDPVTGKLDRCAGFEKIDNAWLSLTGNDNFFGAVLATGATYQSGDATGDIAGPSGLFTRGFQPIGADGVIDGFDIDYVRDNFGDWSSIDDAVFMDLSADVNGDLVVDLFDACKLVQGILETQFGDVNLDGVVDGSDAAIVNANLGNPGGWADGDVNLDGVVDADDAAIIAAGGVNLCCPADLNGDGTVGSADLALLLGSWGGSGASDLDGSGMVGSADLALLLGSWGDCPE